MKLNDILKIYFYFNLWANVKDEHFRNCALRLDISLGRSVDDLRGAFRPC